MLVVTSRKVLRLFMVLCIGFFMVVGCEPDPLDPSSFTLTMQMEGEGTVGPDVGTHEYDEGAVVNIIATSAEGYVFKEWVGEVANTGSAETTVLMDKDQTVTAVFKEFDDHVIEFEDENLEQAVREVIGKLEGDLYLSDVIHLEALEVRGKGILSLEGIEHLQYLKGLVFTSNQVSDISPLQSLTSLEWLVFWNNQVSDISPLQNLTSLTELRFEDNQVSDISPLQNLTSLTELWFEDNQVSDISPLQNLTSLTSLGFWSNQVSDISPLQNLTSLEWLGFWNNQVSDISPLQNLTSLTDLYFGSNQVSDISPLQNLTSLKWLGFWNNQVSDISPLQNLTSLTDLYFGNNQVLDISSLVANTGFGSGDYIDMRSNYLDLSEGSQNMQDINTLINRGIYVEYEPQLDPEVIVAYIDYYNDNERDYMDRMWEDRYFYHFPRD